MSDLALYQSRMVMRFQEMIESIDCRHKTLGNQFNMYTMALDSDVEDMTSELFVERVLDAMKELGKASPAVQEFVNNYSTEDQQMALIQDVDEKFKKDCLQRQEVNDQLDEAVQKFWDARDAFEREGGICLDVMISARVPFAFSNKMMGEHRNSFEDIYTKVLAEGGVFEMLMEHLGYDDKVRVVRTENQTPEIATASQSIAKDVSERLSNLVWEYASHKLPAECSKHIQEAIGESIVELNTDLDCLPDSLPLADIYIKTQGARIEDVGEAVDNYKAQRIRSRNLDSSNSFSL